MSLSGQERAAEQRLRCEPGTQVPGMLENEASWPRSGGFLLPMFWAATRPRVFQSRDHPGLVPGAHTQSPLRGSIVELR